MKEFTNWNLVSVPGHPFFKFFIEYILDHALMFPINYNQPRNIERENENRVVHEYTGPSILLKAVACFY